MEILLLTLFVLFVIFIYKEYKRPENFPPGPNWILPFVGSSRYLKKLSQHLGGQHKAFAYLEKKFNSPIFSIRLGQKSVVVVRSYDLVKEVHSRDEFDGRPDDFFIRLRTMGTRLGIVCTDGLLWHQQRSFVVRQLRNVGYGKTRMEEQIRVELKEVLGILRDLKGEPIWPDGSKLITTSVVNILWTFITGAKIKRDNTGLVRLYELLKKRSKAFDMSGGLLNQMPWLRYIAPEAVGYNLIKDLNVQFYKFFMEFVSEHLENYSEEKAGDDLIYAYIKEMREQSGNENSTFNVQQLVMVILDIFIAGASTTGTTIDLALMSMIVFTDVQEKVQQEIDEVLGDVDELPRYIERNQMPYTEAVLLEVQRFYSILPITGPRRTLRPTKLGGYNLPENTTILIGLDTVLKDEAYWKDPHSFRPERFLNEDNKIYNTERLLPFGAGHRRCLGDQLAKECLFTFFVGMLKEFKLEKVKGEEPSLDLLPGIMMTPKPYKIAFKSRQ